MHGNYPLLKPTPGFCYDKFFLRPPNQCRKTKGGTSMTNTQTHQTTQPDPDFARYLLKADTSLIRCVDERQAKDNTNGVEIPGAIYGLIDAIKHFTHCSEEEAWKRAKEAGLPIDGHIDEHHGAKGCGYGRLVEEQPATVMAPEAVPAQQRLAKIQEAEGQVLMLLGDHHPTHAIINHRVDYSLDPDQATKDGFGIFNFDAWAARRFGAMLGLDEGAFAMHLEEVYKKTVTALTGITQFHEVR